MNQTAVNIARLVYLLICQGAGVAIALSTKGAAIEISVAVGMLIGLAIALSFIALERLMKGFTLRGFSTATFGLGVGLFCAWLLTRVQVSTLLEMAFENQISNSVDGESLASSLQLALNITLFASLGFLGMALALRTNRDDFAFIIPYVRFREDASSGQPIVLDAETIMDGRILNLLTSGFIRGRLIVGQHTLEDLRTLANEGPQVLRLRAQRGLVNLGKMQASKEVPISIHDVRTSGEEQTPHSRLVEMAKFYGARLMTLEDSLAKFAKLQGVSVLNLNELDNALRSPIAVGDRLRVSLVRPGKEEGQAIGYLPDGCMIVVNHAAAELGNTVDVVVITMIHNASGYLIFGELASY
jgi:uncharacterized protein YacL